MTPDVVYNKKESIERCIRQVRLYYALPSNKPFALDFLKQDAIAINLQRAAEQSIDLANHIIRKRKLGLPKDSRDSFDILVSADVISPELATKLKGMVGFRNIMVHTYRELDLNIMRDVIENRLDDLVLFTNNVLAYLEKPPAKLKSS
jgi:uncharacterized protein YutE (UPF0331/DUF86 family)